MSNNKSLKIILNIGLSLFSGIIITFYNGYFHVVDTWLKQLLLVFAIALLVFFTLYKGFLNINKYAIIFAATYTFIMLMGIEFSIFGTLFPKMPVKQIIINLVQGPVFFLVFLCLYSVFKHAMEHLEECKKMQANELPADNMLQKKRKTIKGWIVFLVLFTDYGLWLYILRPNLATYDSANQISQAFGWIPLANNNPFAHTLMMRAVLKPAFIITGNVLSSIVVYEVFSVLVFSIITTTIILFFEGVYHR